MAYKVKSVAIYFIYICTSILICLYVYYGVQEKENFKESPGFKKSTSNQCDSVLRPKKLDIRQEIWQVAKVTKSNSSDDAVYSMHAYYDNRAMMKGEHAVRLFLVLDPSSKEALEERIYCYFWIEQEKHPYFITGSIVPDTPFSIRVIHKTTYYQMLLTCNVPSFLKDRVTHVSFSAEPCIDVQVYLPVTYPKNTGQFLHQFGQCNANGILFGYVSDKEARFMVEWIEMGLAFGIGEFNLYNGTMQTSAAFRRVLDYYVGKGILRIYHQIPPISGIDPNNRESVEFAMRTGFHDCMYRNMYRYEYIVYTDLDEIIVPKEPYTSYGEIIKRLSSDKPIAQVVFPSLAFFQIILQESQQVISRWNLTVTNYVKSVLTGTQPKTFINPRMCIRGYSHACSIMSQNSTLQLGVNYGQVNHYRNMCLKKGIFRITPETCKKYLRSISENKLIAKFVTQTFYDRVKSVQRILKI